MDILQLSKKLISYDSTKDNLQELNKIIMASSEELKGFKHRIFNNKNYPSVIYYNANNLKAKFKIILNAHLDVVPGNRKQFVPNISGDRLLGRGSYDMKAASAVLILVYKALANRVNYPLALQLVTDEENGGYHGTKYQIQKGINTDFVIAGEPTDFEINNQAKGILWLKLNSKGTSAHGAQLWEGKNSLFLLNNALNNIWSRYPIPSKEVWKTTVNLSKISSTNVTFNKVPDNAEAWLDFRYIPEDEKKIISDVKRILPKNIDMDINIFEPPQYTDKNNIYIRKLQLSVKRTIGENIGTIKKHYGSDVRHFNQLNMDGITFGPVGGGMHSDNEWVSIKSLEQYYNILKDFLLSLNA